MHVGFSVMHDDLLSAEVRVSKRRSQKDYRPRFESFVNFADRHETLQVSDAHCEKRRVFRGDEQRRIAVLFAARHERNDYEFLPGEPVESALAQFVERTAVHVFVSDFIGRKIVAYQHAVRVSAAHVIFREVHADAVFAPYHFGFHHVFAIDVVLDGKDVFPVVAEAHFVKFFFARRHGNFRGFFENFFNPAFHFE